MSWDKAEEQNTQRDVMELVYPSYVKVFSHKYKQINFQLKQNTNIKSKCTITKEFVSYRFLCFSIA